MIKKNETLIKRLKKNANWKSLLFQISIYFYPLLLFCVFWVGTNVNSIVMAFQNISALDGTRSFAGLKNFGDFLNGIFGQSDNALLRTSFINSFKMYFINLSICMPLYLLFSFYMFKKMFGSKIYLIIIMLPSIVSSFIVSLIFKRFVNVVLPDIFSEFGVEFPVLLQDPQYTFGTMLFYMIWLSFSTSLIVYPNAMRAIDPQILESARIDGAGFWREFWSIIMPLIMPTISTFIVIGVSDIFITSGPLVEFFQWNAYPEVYTFGYYFTAKTMTASNEFEYPLMAAGGLILTLMSTPITFLVKWLLEKVTPEVN